MENSCLQKISRGRIRNRGLYSEEGTCVQEETG